ncbi:hypothetical protein SAMN00017405_1127 [Desulfonispora thiosulfatigenes DSM 11270]|uniref:Uncharacterized protein n=1 Tax=Desulfonispora thiosulfatigenes DSM 11270 TaxID=656914 RepID=A0A1W1UZI7_DESTI|nr:hypothetical protein SAMN00017405_1127 [Desulfonispora thiosulfatigenes DSM 11270]
MKIYPGWPFLSIRLNLEESIMPQPVTSNAEIDYSLIEKLNNTLTPIYV